MYTLLDLSTILGYLSYPIIAQDIFLIGNIGLFKILSKSFSEYPNHISIFINLKKSITTFILKR